MNSVYVEGFYDKNSFLWLNCKLSRFWGGEGSLFSMQDSVIHSKWKSFPCDFRFCRTIARTTARKSPHGTWVCEPSWLRNWILVCNLASQWQSVATFFRARHKEKSGDFELRRKKTPQTSFLLLRNSKLPLFVLWRARKKRCDTLTQVANRYLALRNEVSSQRAWLV